MNSEGKYESKNRNYNNNNNNKNLVWNKTQPFCGTDIVVSFSLCSYATNSPPVCPSVCLFVCLFGGRKSLIWGCLWVVSV